MGCRDRWGCQGGDTHRVDRGHAGNISDAGRATNYLTLRLSELRRSADALDDTGRQKHARITFQTGSNDLKRIRTKVLSKYCFASRTPWALTVERREGAWVVCCKNCGTVRRPLVLWYHPDAPRRAEGQALPVQRAALPVQRATRRPWQGVDTSQGLYRAAMGVRRNSVLHTFHNAALGKVMKANVPTIRCRRACAPCDDRIRVDFRTADGSAAS